MTVEQSEQRIVNSYEERATVEVERNSRGTNWKVGYSTQNMDRALEVVMAAVAKLKANFDPEPEDTVASWTRGA